MNGVSFEHHRRLRLSLPGPLLKATRLASRHIVALCGSEEDRDALFVVPVAVPDRPNPDAPLRPERLLRLPGTAVTALAPLSATEDVIVSVAGAEPSITRVDTAASRPVWRLTMDEVAPLAVHHGVIDAIDGGDRLTRFDMNGDEVASFALGSRALGPPTLRHGSSVLVCCERSLVEVASRGELRHLEIEGTRSVCVGPGDLVIAHDGERLMGFRPGVSTVPEWTVEVGPVESAFAVSPLGWSVLRSVEGGAVCVDASGEVRTRTLDGRHFHPPALDLSGAIVLPSRDEASLIVLPPVGQMPVMGWPVSLPAIPVTTLVEPHVCTVFGVGGEVDELRLIVN